MYKNREKNIYNMEINIYYHGLCNDGFACAYIMSKYFKYLRKEDNITYIPIYYSHKDKQYDKMINNLKDDQENWFLDITPNRYQLDILRESPATFNFCDHHATALADLFGRVPECRGFGSTDGNISIWGGESNDKSACILLYDYLVTSTYGKFNLPKEFVQILQHISDRDVWQFQYLDTKDVCSSIAVHNYTFEEWDTFNLKELILEGKAINKYIEANINKLLKEAKEINIGQHKAVSINSNFEMSTVGNRLLEKFPVVDIAVVYVIGSDGKFRCSLRSRNDFDCSKIAKFFGGGGHAQACGCLMNNLEEFNNYG